MEAVQEPVVAVDAAQEPVVVVDAAREPVVVVDAAREPVVVVDAAREPVVVVDAAREPVVAVGDTRRKNREGSMFQYTFVFVIKDHNTRNATKVAALWNKNLIYDIGNTQNTYNS